MHAQEYKVQLGNFEGPLDLLLYLIRKAEVEITAIPIAEITDQYLAHIEGVERLDIDLAGEFLVMAATLMELKSRAISPAEPLETDGEGVSAIEDALDPRSELVQQLLAYKWARDAAEALERKREDWERQFPAHRVSIDKQSLAQAIEQANEVELEDLELFDLVEAFERIVEQVNFDRLGDHHVAIDETPIEIHIEDIVDQLKRSAPDARGSRAMSFRSIFHERTLPEVIGLFLATLELVRRRSITVRQDGAEGEILITLNDDPVNVAPQEVVVTP